MKNNSLGTKILMTAVTLGLLAYFGSRLTAILRTR